MTGLSRWIATDPSGPNDHPNLYVYCHDSPLKLSDSSGLASSDENGTTSDGGTDNISSASVGKDTSTSFTDTDANGDKLSAGIAGSSSSDIPIPQAEPRLLWDRKKGVCHDQDGSYYDNSIFADRARHQQKETLASNERMRRLGPQVGASSFVSFHDDPFLRDMERTGQFDAILDYGIFPALPKGLSLMRGIQLSGGAVSVTASVSRNSASYIGPSEVYEIWARSKATNQTYTYKYGVGSQGYTSAGLSQRAESQLSAIRNTVFGGEKFGDNFEFGSRIVLKFDARKPALAWESYLVDQHTYLKGYTPLGNDLPQANRFIPMRINLLNKASK
jgi:hypothetical protein